MRRTRFGVIGLGWFGEKHCEALAEIADVELYALCTRNESRLNELAARFSVTQAFTDYREMLRDPELEAVSIVTMWDQHVQPALAALAAGKHVFLEKPMASTVADCEQIVRAADTARGYLMVGHICRFNPRYAAAKEAIAAGRIGRILSLYARRNIPAAVTDEILNKIGPIIGDGVHDTDLMLWYTQDRIVSAYAQTVDVRGRKYPDLGWTMYRFAGGATGILENVWCLPDRTPFQIDERLEIIGTTGSIHIQETHPNFSISDADGWHSPDTTYWPTLHGRRAGALVAELTYFARCVRAGERPTIITPPESLEAVRACLAAEESARTGQIVRIQ
ncbi:MAG: Gfo/Idh/MocA family oxidoreductase [Planctomycetaceae bacterium]